MARIAEVGAKDRPTLPCKRHGDNSAACDPAYGAGVASAVDVLG